MAAKKKCFVISPIGEEESDVRKEADALLWVARSALERYDFEVIRVDQIARAAIITNDIIQLIQEAELCLIVLTGENPNVFYEAGRRHEAGRPFIQLVKRGERIPFDVAGIRTIIYDDIQTVASASKTAAEIQSYIEEYEKSGYGASGTGVSLTTIAGALDRIERKLGNLGASASGIVSIASQSSDPLVIMRNPREAFMKAVAQGDIQTAARVLPRLEQLLGPSPELVAAAAFLCVAGHEPAMELINSLLVENWSKFWQDGKGAETVQAGIGAIVQFYVVTDREVEGVERCKPLIVRLLNEPDAEVRVRAFVLNQQQMLYYGARMYQDALETCEQVLELFPEDPAYLYNASLIYEKLGLSNKALDMVDRYLVLDSEDPLHLAHAVEIYSEAGRIEDARRVFELLSRRDPGRAAILRMQGVRL